MVLFLTVSNSNAQNQPKPTTMKDCCMMKEGKMMCMKDGKAMPMNKTMIMKNGTTCASNGECTMKDGKKMMMKEGDCMDMNGKMCTDEMKMMTQKKTTKKVSSAVYTCPMHSEVVGAKGGKCPKCGMELVLKTS
ncbi:MAG: DUF6799 domain-containing protein [Flavobacterium sp.]